MRKIKWPINNWGLILRLTTFILLELLLWILFYLVGIASLVGIYFAVRALR